MEEARVNQDPTSGRGEGAEALEAASSPLLEGRARRPAASPPEAPAAENLPEGPASSPSSRSPSSASSASSLSSASSPSSRASSPHGMASPTSPLAAFSPQRRKSSYSSAERFSLLSASAPEADASPSVSIISASSSPFHAAADPQQPRLLQDSSAAAAGSSSPVLSASSLLSGVSHSASSLSLGSSSQQQYDGAAVRYRLLQLMEEFYGIQQTLESVRQFYVIRVHALEDRLAAEVEARRASELRAVFASDRTLFIEEQLQRVTEKLRGDVERRDELVHILELNLAYFQEQLALRDRRLETLEKIEAQQRQQIKLLRERQAEREADAQPRETNPLAQEGGPPPGRVPASAAENRAAAAAVAVAPGEGRQGEEKVAEGGQRGAAEQSGRYARSETENAESGGDADKRRSTEALGNARDEALRSEGGLHLDRERGEAAASSSTSACTSSFSLIPGLTSSPSSLAPRAARGAALSASSSAAPSASAGSEAEAPLRRASSTAVREVSQPSSPLARARRAPSVASPPPSPPPAPAAAGSALAACAALSPESATAILALRERQLERVAGQLDALNFLCMKQGEELQKALVDLERERRRREAAQRDAHRERRRREEAQSQMRQSEKSLQYRATLSSSSVPVSIPLLPSSTAGSGSAAPSTAASASAVAPTSAPSQFRFPPPEFLADLKAEVEELLALMRAQEPRSASLAESAKPSVSRQNADAELGSAPDDDVGWPSGALATARKPRSAERRARCASRRVSPSSRSAQSELQPVCKAEAGDGRRLEAAEEEGGQGGACGGHQGVRASRQKERACRRESMWSNRPEEERGVGAPQMLNDTDERGRQEVPSAASDPAAPGDDSDSSCGDNTDDAEEAQKAKPKSSAAVSSLAGSSAASGAGPSSSPSTSSALSLVQQARDSVMKAFFPLQASLGAEEGADADSAVCLPSGQHRREKHTRGTEAAEGAKEAENSAHAGWDKAFATDGLDTAVGLKRRRPAERDEVVCDKACERAAVAGSCTLPRRGHLQTETGRLWVRRERLRSAGCQRLGQAPQNLPSVRVALLAPPPTGAGTHCGRETGGVVCCAHPSSSPAFREQATEDAVASFLRRGFQWCEIHCGAQAVLLALRDRQTAPPTGPQSKPPGSVCAPAFHRGRPHDAASFIYSSLSAGDVGGLALSTFGPARGGRTSTQSDTSRVLERQAPAGDFSASGRKPRKNEELSGAENLVSAFCGTERQSIRKGGRLTMALQSPFISVQVFASGLSCVRTPSLAGDWEREVTMSQSAVAAVCEMDICAGVLYTFVGESAEHESELLTGLEVEEGGEGDCV
ncbi:hypothetical protein BESB_085350 [Besnoitia besnoiti]|uniref:Uncharacterized protein n=1 Tax=Besnoitia besnoiti TaxID=94643 RepID=A0A2A9MBP8_BESBE|nr:hypothetical protein BESB_085350 [Besnoitia besnoiti]PFH33336.1 hypothetical protein BESB_085350 [Besnoitia besnoiti]